jgi:RimJ/RimL family protein N-acetyltransferase
MIVNSKRIIIEKFQRKDIDNEYLSWINNKSLLKYSRNKDKKYNYKKALQEFNFILKKKNFFLKIVEKKNQKKIGTVIAYVYKKIKLINVGILIGNKNFLNKGYGTEVYKILIDYFLNKKKIDKLEIGCIKKNLPIIRICRKLKLSFASQKGNFLKFFRLRKKINYVGVCCKDLGSGNQILNYIMNDKKNKYFFYLKKPSIDIFKKQFKNKKNFFFMNTVDQLLNNINKLIVGTGSSNFEKSVAKKSLDRKIYTISVVDHFSDIRKRFFFKKKKFIPNEIWVFNKFIKDYLKKFFNVKIVLKKNFYIKKFKFNKRYKNESLLFIGEPFFKKNNKFTHDQVSLDFFLRNVSKLKLGTNKIIIKLHPKQTFMSYKKIIEPFKKDFNIIINKYGNLQDCFKKTKYVFGLTSYALIIAAYLKKNVYHLKLPWQKIKLLPIEKIKSFYKSVNSVN